MTQEAQVACMLQMTLPVMQGLQVQDHVHLVVEAADQMVQLMQVCY
jgi:hypothetical protein